MIKVVRNKVKEIAVGDLTDSHFIGVQYPSGVKGIIVKLKADKYITCVNESNEVWDKREVYGSIQEAAAFVKECYVFESGKELFNWVANG